MIKDYDVESVEMHRALHGKWEMGSKVALKNQDDLSLAYTPGVAAVCQQIVEDPAQSYSLTMKGNSVAIISDGSAVLGLGDIGPEASLPVMEGKAILFKEFAGIDSIPLVVNRGEDTAEFIQTIRNLAPTFGGINLEDIKAPICFEVEDALQDLGIPVFHDDQHGTAVVLLAALINGVQVANKEGRALKIVVNGAGAAGTAIIKLLQHIKDMPNSNFSIEEIYACDSRGIISPDRTDLSFHKQRLLAITNSDKLSGSVYDAIRGADVFVGVSKGNLLKGEHIQTMARDPIVFALANPVPEIMPEIAKLAGASVVGTGRSDLPNQVNNVLAFPGIFRGALDIRAKRITNKMKLKAAEALAKAVARPRVDKILPNPIERSVVPLIAAAVREAV